MNLVKFLKPNLTLPLISSVRNINYKFPMPTKSLKEQLEGIHCYSIIYLLLRFKQSLIMN